MYQMLYLLIKSAHCYQNIFETYEIQIKNKTWIFVLKCEAANSNMQDSIFIHRFSKLADLKP